MDIKELKSLIKMVTETDIAEFELESENTKMRLKRFGADMVAYQPAPQVVHTIPSVPVTAVHAPQAAAATTSAEAEAPEKGNQVTSPIVGTFYRAPAPDAPPYVEVGQVIEKGQVFCIVEAMKLMNEIEAEYRCKIIKICKENAQPVEFGDTLFLVEPL
jgi:acetyl-CoA carboxylase biotin carboxyl carrier protein